MTEEDCRRLTKFEERLHDFIRVQRDLRTDNQKLQNQLKEKESQLLALSEELCTLREKYARLQTAKTIDNTADQNLRDTKQRLSKMVREIDKCIALLNE